MKNKKVLIGVIIVIIIVIVIAIVVSNMKASNNSVQNNNTTITNQEAKKENTAVEKENATTKNEQTNTASNNSTSNTNTTSQNKSTTKSKQTGTAGSNMPLKDNEEEAKHQIEVAMQSLLEETYGNKVYDARIYVEKIYSSEEEKKEPLKSLNIGIDDVAFSVRYELKPSNGVDVNEFLAGTGKYDKQSGWVTQKYGVGILKPTGNSKQKYKITNFGTGW